MDINSLIVNTDDGERKLAKLHSLKCKSYIKLSLEYFHRP